jgi:hypothetical protein
MLALGGLGIIGNFASAASKSAEKSRNTPDTSMRVGECITQMAYLAQSFTSSPDNDCANPANTYLLAAKGDSSATCPDGKRDHSVYDRYTDDSTILCFALNLIQDQCYQLAGDLHNPRVSLGECGDIRPGLVTVVRRIDGSADKSQCPAGSKGVSYPVLARVYCLARASA